MQDMHEIIKEAKELIRAEKGVMDEEKEIVDRVKKERNKEKLKTQRIIKKYYKRKSWIWALFSTILFTFNIFMGLIVLFYFVIEKSNFDIRWFYAVSTLITIIIAPTFSYGIIWKFFREEYEAEFVKIMNKELDEVKVEYNEE